MISAVKRKVWARLEDVVRGYQKQRAKDIILEMQMQALRESASYASRRMLSARVLRDRFEVLDAAIQAITVPGLCLEFGVYKGRTVNYIARALPNSQVFGFDSFEGLPDDWVMKSRKGHFKVSDRAFMAELHPNVEIVEGWFADSLPCFLETHKDPVAFVHIDCDIYSSTKTVLENLRPRLSRGTVIVFDEYFNYPGWKEHEFKAFQEFISQSGLRYRYLAFCGVHEQVAVILE